MTTIPDLCCVICHRPVPLRYYFCTEHLHFRDDKTDWVRFLVRDAAAARMRWLSRSKSRTKMANFSDLTIGDQRSLGIDGESNLLT